MIAEARVVVRKYKMPTCRFQRYTCQISIGSTKDRYLREAPDILTDTHTKMADKKEKKEHTTEMKKEEKKEEKKQVKTDEKKEDTKEVKKEEKKEEKKQEKRDENKEEKKDEKKEEKKDEKVGAKDKRKWPMTYQEEMEYLTKFEGVTHKQKLSYLNFFKMADKSNAGAITVLEFRDAVCAIGFSGESFEIAAMFVDLNPNEDRFVTIDEFMNEMCKEDSRKRTDKDMKMIFDELDANKDGLITPDEIALNLKKNNRSMLEDNIQSMIRKNDRDHDGGLSFKEFIAAVKRK